MVHEHKPVVNCHAIILAAGRSERIGMPKQLLEYQGKTLLQNTIDAAKGANVQSIMVVLGSNMERIMATTNIKGTTVVENKTWQTGMASSIVTGITALKDIDSLADGALLMVCDQPFVSSTLLDELIAAQRQRGKPIAACRYSGISGVPVLFHRDMFDELLTLKGDQGARKIIQQAPEIVTSVDFPDGSIDIDTMGEYEKLK